MGLSAERERERDSWAFRNAGPPFLWISYDSLGLILGLHLWTSPKLDSIKTHFMMP